VLGRVLRADDDVIGAAPVAVLSHAAWQRRFGGDSAVIGRQLEMHDDGATYTIVGVMPPGLDFPKGTDFWTAIAPSSVPKDMHVIARLARGATPEQAQSEMTAFLRRGDAPEWQRNFTGEARALPGLVVGDTRPALLAFAAASVVLLLITCINVANLLLVRGFARVREIAVRSAIGAGRGRVIVQLLTENSLLAVAGGVTGVAVAAGAVRSFVVLAPSSLPRIDEIGLNAAALGGATGISIVALLLFAIAPAVVASRVDLQSVLRSGARQSDSRASRSAAEFLVAGQVAMALIVLSAAGLIARSLINLERAELSFESSPLIIGNLSFQSSRLGNPAAQTAMLERLTERLEVVPGVQSVAPVVAVPFSGAQGWDGRPTADGQSADEAAANPMLNMEVVTPSYFRTLGIRVLRGRTFTDADRDGAQRVAVLSESAARHYWPAGNAIDGRLFMGRAGDPAFTVVGIVPDTRYRDLRTARPSIYFPLRQSIFPFAPANLAIRTSSASEDIVPAIRQAVAEVDAGVALLRASPFDDYRAAPLAQPRLNAVLLAVFAVASVVLAAIGLFGVMAATVRRRTRELGVRMALGATGADLRRMIVRRGVAIAAGGASLGLLGALSANRLLGALLYEVSPTDGVTIGTVAGILLVVAFVASLIPARWSTRVDPVVALRAD
jgi:predicted permease